MGIISGKSSDVKLAMPKAESLFISNIEYCNTSAKFWPALIDEAQKDYPGWSSIELSAPTDDTLKRKYLFPSSSLGNIDNLFAENIREVMSNIEAEMDILGPPSPVSIRLLDGENEVLSRDLSQECIDSEIFACLLVWLLEWAGIPEQLWNNESVEGELHCEDRERGLEYDLDFFLIHRHMHEGLYMRTLLLVPEVSLLA